MDWKEYENEVFELLKLYYKDALIERDVKKKGRYSMKLRQIDIYIEETIGGVKTVVIVDCKCYNKKVDVKTVESFIGMADDLNADVGLMITEKGFTPTAIKRAYNNPEYIELDILNLAELGEFQAEWAIPYAGDNGALLLAPFGWIIDARKSLEAKCFMYTRGNTFEQAALKKEVAYINFWDRHKNNESLDDLIAIQEKYIKDSGRLIKIAYANLNRDDFKTVIRESWIEGYPGPELTGFIEFDEFILFCVWFSDELALKRNNRKLERLLKMTLPLKINHNSKGV